MKVICNRNALGNALSLLTSVVGVRTPRPILQCLRMQTEDDGLTILATDLELGLRYHIKEVEIAEPGQVVAPASRLSAIVHEIEDETVALTSTPDDLTVSATGATFKLFTFDPDEFPPVAAKGDGKRFTIPAGILKTVADRTVYSAAKETSRYAIDGLFMQVKGNKIVMVGTDGRRLARASSTIGASVEEDIECIIPSKAVSMLDRLAADVDAPINVTITDSQAAFAAPDVLLLSTLVEGRFPSYEAVIPKESGTKVTIGRLALLAAVRRAALMTSKESKSIKVTVGAENLTIEARVPEQGEATIELPAEIKGEPVEIAFNPEFLIDPLRILGHDQVNLELNSSTTPAVLKAGPDFVYVIMPVTTA